MSEGGTVRRPRRGRPMLGWSLILLAMVAAVYGGMVGHRFVFDDYGYILKNPNILQGFSARGLSWAFGTVYGGNWHPLTWASHLLDFSLFGLDPRGPHFVNLLLHAANTLLLAWCLAGITGALKPAVLAAAVFAVHPLHVESAAWVAERKDLLSGLFGILTLAAYGAYARRPGWRRYVTVMAAMSLGLMAKAMVVTLPFVMLLLDVWPLGRLAPFPGRGRRPPGGPGTGRAAGLLWEKIPFLALSALSSAVTYWAQKDFGAVGYLPAAFRISNALVSYVRYLGKAFWPDRLAVFYPHPEGGIPAWQAWGSLLLLAAVSALALRLIRSRPYLAVGWFWFLGMMVPVIGLVQVGSQAMADRYTYLPLIGPLVALAALAASAAGRPAARPLLAAGIPAALLGLALTARAQVGFWRNETSLFGHALAVTEDNWLAHNNLGTALGREGKTAEAEKEFREALRIWPEYVDAYNNLGQNLDGRGDMRGALTNYLEALTRAPRYGEAQSNLAWSLMGRAVADRSMTRFTLTLPAAAVSGDGAIVRSGGDAGEVYFLGNLWNGDQAVGANNMGLALCWLGSDAEALGLFEESARLASAYAFAYNNLGGALRRLGRKREAAAAYTRALELQPGLREAVLNLGNL